MTVRPSTQKNGAFQEDMGHGTCNSPDALYSKNHRQLRDCVISPSERMTGHEAKEDAPRGVLFGFQ